MDIDIRSSIFMTTLTTLSPDTHRPEFDGFPMVGMAIDYPDQYHVAPHQHQKAQLLYALSGVMVVGSALGQWVVPPSRGLWLPAHCQHWIRMVGEVKVRTIFMPSEETTEMPAACCVLNISSLLRELIICTLNIPQDYSVASKQGRLIQVLIDELRPAPVLPMHLPSAQRPRIQQICNHILQQPDQSLTATQWARHFHVHPKTIHRQFMQETGMTIGEWRQQAKLLIAMEMLAKGQKILDIALDLGYGSPSAFTAMFKKQLGIVPSAFFAIDH